MQLGKQEKIECSAQVLEVGLKRQDRQYALEYSLFNLQNSESFSHRFYFLTGELAGSCQGEDSMGCLMGCSDRSLSLFFFPSLPLSSD